MPSTASVSVEYVYERSVRFDEQCVLIPEQSRPRKGLLQLNSRPRLASKGFTLPIWPTASNSNSNSQEKIHGAEEKERGRKLSIGLPRYVSLVEFV